LFLCDGIESEAERVKKKTAEDFYFWMEGKVKYMKKMIQTESKVKRASS